MNPPEVLSYATAATAAPPNDRLRRSSLFLSMAAGGVGLSLLGLYALTYVEAFAVAGFFWLGIGGLMTLVAFCCGAVYAGIAVARRFPPPSTSRRALVSVLLPMLVVAIAYGCMAGGAALMNHQAYRIILINEGSTPIDRMVFFSESFNHTEGPLAPGDRTYFYMPRRPREALYLSVHIGAQSMPYTVTESMSTSEQFGPRYVKLNGLTGYKNREGREPD